MGGEDWWSDDDEKVSDSASLIFVIGALFLAGGGILYVLSLMT